MVRSTSAVKITPPLCVGDGGYKVRGSNLCVLKAENMLGAWGVKSLKTLNSN